MIRFPKKRFEPEWVQNWQRYYHLRESPDMHYDFVLNLFLQQGLEIEYYDPAESAIRHQRHFEIGFFGKKVLMDISDFEEVHASHAEFDAVFKFHYNAARHRSLANIYPFSPVSFTRWDLYNTLKAKLRYRGHGLIRNNQSEVPWAQERRRFVRRLIERNFRGEADTRFYGGSPEGQLKYFEGIPHTLVSVHVPGSRTAMLDRGQAQMMGFGVCTVSPTLPEMLPWNKKPLPGEHYLACREDYSDLIEILEWCQGHPEELVRIGRSSQTLFQESMTPERLVSWMRLSCGIQNPMQ